MLDQKLCFKRLLACSFASALIASIALGVFTSTSGAAHIGGEHAVNTTSNVHMQKAVSPGDSRSQRGVTLSSKYFTTFPCGVQCGLSGSGGEHFWVIASYANLLTGYVIADIGIECAFGMSFFLTPVGAAAACGTLIATLRWAAINKPALTQHGVWYALYLNGHLAGGTY